MKQHPTFRRILAFLLCALLLQAARPAPPGGVSAIVAPEAAARCFAETGICLRGRFLTYWEAHGGLALNGYPLTLEFTQTLEDGQPYTVQYLERTRLEYHPENPPPHDLLASQFGRRIHPADPPLSPIDGAVYFPETGHSVTRPAFATYWQAHGGLAQFGYPLSEEFSERLEDGQVYRVQYFERARFEYHPENRSSDDVLLGQLGRRVLAEVAPGEPALVLQAPSGPVAWSPDGQLLATGGGDGVRLWDSTGQLMATLPVPAAALAWSADGQTLAAAVSFEDTGVQLWSRAGSLKATLESHAFSSYLPLVWSPDGRILATADENRVRLWDADGRSLATLTGHTGGIAALAWSPDSQILASGTFSDPYGGGASNDPVRLWSPSGASRGTLDTIGDCVALAWSPDGQSLATACNTVQIWAPDGRRKATLRDAADWTTLLAWSPDGRTLATGGHTTQLWSATGGLRATLESDPSFNLSLVWSPNGCVIATGSVNAVRLWGDDGQPLAILRGHIDGIRGLAWSPDGQTLASGSFDQSTRLWHPFGRLAATPDGHTGPVEALVWSPDGRTFATGSWDRTARLWDSGGRLLLTLPGYGSALVWSPDGQLLAIGGGDGTVRLWNATGQLQATLVGHVGIVSHLAWSPDSQILATGATPSSRGYDATVRLWSRSGDLLTLLDGHGGGCLALAWSPDGQTLATVGGYVSGVMPAYLWSATGERRATLGGAYLGQINTLAWSPDGQTLATGASPAPDGAVWLWNPKGMPRGSLPGHTGEIGALAWSPDGRTLASVDASDLRLWDVGNRTALLLPGIRSVAWSPDGRFFATFGQDTMLGVDTIVRLWTAAGQLTGTLRQAVRPWRLAWSPDSRVLATSEGSAVRLWPIAPPASAVWQGQSR